MPAKSILIVDDSLLIVDRLQTMLKELDNPGPVGCALDYPSAMQQIKESLPDIVLLDINLPGGNGIGILRYIKTQLPATVVIMLTNQADDYYRNICRKWGADFFIDKSREFDQVIPVLSTIL